MKRATAIRMGLAMAGLTLLLAGCSNSPSYACGAAPGGKCESVTDAYFAAIGKKPGGKGGGKGGGNGTAKATEATARVTQYIPEGVAIRTQPQVMRVWVAPWEDNSGVFHDQGYSYFVADPGEWTLRANTEKSIYGGGYRALGHPTEKSTGTDNKDGAGGKVTLPPAPAAPAMTKGQAKGQAMDFLGENANVDG